MPELKNKSSARCLPTASALCKNAQKRKLLLDAAKKKRQREKRLTRRFQEIAL